MVAERAGCIGAGLEGAAIAGDQELVEVAQQPTGCGLFDSDFQEDRTEEGDQVVGDALTAGCVQFLDQSLGDRAQFRLWRCGGFGPLVERGLTDQGRQRQDAEHGKGLHAHAHRRRMQA